MKGVVFIAINDLVESQFGISTWEKILEAVSPECGGVYTSTEDYPDEDVVKYVQVISAELAIPASDVTRTYGKFLFGELNRKYDIFTKLSNNLFEFLNSIEGVIHKEVRKLYPNPSLPTLDCTIKSDTELELEYHSPRQLCYLAEGLIYGAAEHYGEDIVLSHDQCMHTGSDKCILRVLKNG